MWLLFGLLLVASQTSELAAADCGGQVIPSPNTGTGESVLMSVAAVSATDMWSVGLSYPTDNGEQALIEHWDGAAWKVVPAPTLPTRHQLSARLGRWQFFSWRSRNHRTLGWRQLDRSSTS